MEISSTDWPITRRYARRKSGAAHCPKRNGRYRFLNSKFKSIPGYRLSVDDVIISDDISCSSLAPLRENIMAFYHDFGIDANVPQLTGNLKKDLSMLYNDFTSNLPDKSWGVEIVNTAYGERTPLQFVLCKEVRGFPYNTVFSMPVKKMCAAAPMEKELLLAFFAFLHRMDMYAMPDEHNDFIYCCGQAENSFACDKDGNPKFDDEVVECWDDEYKNWAQRYAFGDISNMMCDIVETEKSTGFDAGVLSQNLQEQIDSCRGAVSDEFLNAISELLGICQEGYLFDYHILSLQNVFGNDFMMEGTPFSDGFMEFTRLFFFCYDCDDPVCEQVMDCINGDAYNLEIGMLHNYAILGKDDIREKMADTFPQKWVKATNKIIELLSDGQNN